MASTTERAEIGKPLINSAAIQAKMHQQLRRVMVDMQRDVMREVKALMAVSVIDRQAAECGIRVAMDASLAERAASLIERMMAKWQPIFDRAANLISGRMLDMTLAHSNRTLGASMEQIGKPVTLSVTPELAARMDAATLESVALIKRVPAQYLPNVQGDVMRSITTGRGLQDLIPALKAQNVSQKNWAENVARDQTRKAYATVNRTRMEESGVKKFKWVHSGGSNKPREYHMQQWPAGLNGGIFSFDDPPIIDKRTGERGFPGQAVYCGCTMSPVIELEEK